MLKPQSSALLTRQACRRRGRRLEHIVQCEDKRESMFNKLREPVNSLTHWGGAILALIGLITLLIVGWGTPAKVISLVIYGASLIFLFSAERDLSHGAGKR